MAVLYYKARDKKGSAVAGKIEAENELLAKRMLSERGLFVLSIGQAGSNPLEKYFHQIRDYFALYIPNEEMLIFNRQLQTSYSVGVSLLQSLSMISEQTENTGLKKVISKIAEELTQGRSLHEAMAQHPRVFDSVYITAIRAGENSGRLDEILDMLCYFSEQQIENKAKIKSATFYPKIVLVMIVVVFVVVMTFVIPKLSGFYSGMGGQLPGITLFMIALSNFVLGYWYLLIAGAAGIYFSFQKFVNSPKGRRTWHGFLLRVPVMGPIFLQSDLLIFATVFSLLVKSGLPIIDALNTVKDSVSNELLRSDIDNCRRAVEEGKPISYGFRESKIFPKMVGNLISIGEESAKVDDILAKVASYYKVQLEYRLNNLAKAIEPAFLILIFGVVLVLVLSVFLPIWKMSQLLRPH
ncbi:MAG: type II secretion system F family protein [Bdellovibrionota bacterium]